MNDPVGEDGKLLDMKDAIVTFTTLMDRATKQNRNAPPECEPITKLKLIALVEKILKQTGADKLPTIDITYKAWQLDTVKETHTQTYTSMVKEALNAADEDYKVNEKDRTKQAIVGYAHKPQDIICHNCGKKGHYQRDCKSRSQHGERGNKKGGTPVPLDVEQIFAQSQALSSPDQRRLRERLRGRGENKERKGKRGSGREDKRSSKARRLQNVEASGSDASSVSESGSDSD